MAFKLAEAYVQITSRLAKFRKGLSKAHALLAKATKKMVQTAKRAAIVLGLAFAGITIWLVKLGMDAEESENLFSVSMGKMAASTRKWSDEMAKRLGLNAFEIRKNVSLMNAMIESMGLASKESTEMSKSIVALSYDLASFYNLNVEDAFDKIRAAISGEAEPLKRLGILVNETTSKTWALNNGLIAQGEKLTEVQKIMARYGVIMQSTKKAQGDLERTSGSLTNVLRSLWSMVKDIAIAIGSTLVPRVNELAKSMKSWIQDNREDIIEWATKVYDSVFNAIDALIAWVKYLQTDWRGAVRQAYDFIVELFKKFWDFAAPYGKKLGKLIWEGIVGGIGEGFLNIGGVLKKTPAGLKREFEPQAKTIKEFYSREGLGILKSILNLMVGMSKQTEIKALGRDIVDSLKAPEKPKPIGAM